MPFNCNTQLKRTHYACYLMILPIATVRERRSALNELVCSTVAWYWQGKAEILEENPVPLPICPPQIPHERGEVRTRARGERLALILWVIERPPSFQLRHSEACLQRSIYGSRKLDFLGLESYTSRTKSSSPVGDINCRVPSFPLGCTYCDSMVTICHGNRTTVDRSFPSHIKYYTKRLTEWMVCKICRLTLRHCVNCQHYTLRQKLKNQN
jgi:hypothetical protein